MTKFKEMITLSTGNAPTQPGMPERVLPLAQQCESPILAPRGWDDLSLRVGGNVAKMDVDWSDRIPRQSLVLYVQMKLQSIPHAFRIRAFG